MEGVLAGHPSRWRVYGEGGASALALHCALAHSGAWAGLGAALPGLSLTALDLPGHGRSADWDGTGDFHGLATRVTAALVERMGAPQHLIGHSFGGTVALRLALERPDLVSRLTLIEPVLFCAAPRDAFAAHVARQAPVDAALRAGDRQGAARAFQAIWGAGQPLEEAPEAQRAYIVGRIHLVAAQFPVLMEDGAGMTAPARLEGVGVPVLLIEGDRSPPVVGAIADVLARRLPHVRRTVVKGAGHMAPITHPGAVAEAIADFAGLQPAKAAINPSTSSGVVDQPATSRAFSPPIR